MSPTETISHSSEPETFTNKDKGKLRVMAKMRFGASFKADSCLRTLLLVHHV